MKPSNKKYIGRYINTKRNDDTYTKIFLLLLLGKMLNLH